MDTRIFSLNVNSAIEYCRRSLLENFLSQNPSLIILLQETKFGPNHGFSRSSHATFYASNRTGCGGAAILIHNGLRVRNVHRMIGLIDGVFVEVKLDETWVTVGSVYIHPTCSDIGDLMDWLGN